MIDRKHFFYALAILVLVAALIHIIAHRGVPRVLQANLNKLPMTIAGYQGRSDRFPQEIYDILQTDQSVYRHYRGPDGRIINLYIGYYGTAKGGRTGHNPYACLPGAGWGIVKTGPIILRPNYYPKGVKLNYIVAKRDENYQVMIHWYQSAGDKVLANGFEQNVQRFIGRVLYNRNDGAFIEVSALAGGQNIKAVRADLKKFALNVLDLLPSYWPVEG